MMLRGLRSTGKLKGAVPTVLPASVLPGPSSASAWWSYVRMNLMVEAQFSRGMTLLVASVAALAGGISAVLGAGGAAAYLLMVAGCVTVYVTAYRLASAAAPSARQIRRVAVQASEDLLTLPASEFLRVVDDERVLGRGDEDDAAQDEVRSFAVGRALSGLPDGAFGIIRKLAVSSEMPAFELLELACGILGACRPARAPRASRLRVGA